MDFYLLCAYYWGVSRREAKTRIINWFYTSSVRQGDYVQINPLTLDYAPVEARFEILAFQGIHLGDT